MKKQFLMALAALSLLGGRTTAQEPACKPPLMGWSSWNAYRVNISEDIIKHQADLMVEKGLKDAGYRFINIDDGFFGYRDETGKMHEHAQRFPNGMKVVVDHIHDLGLKAGIYTDAKSALIKRRFPPAIRPRRAPLSLSSFQLSSKVQATMA